ncbi:hypothetical protein AB0K43_11415 [Kitasatospora sp. NPDC049258]
MALLPYTSTTRMAAAPQLVPITVDGREQLVPRQVVRAYERGLIRL